MNIILTYDCEKDEVKINGTKNLSPVFRVYVDEIIAVYQKHMRDLISSGMIPEGKLEINLQTKPKTILKM